MNLLKQGLFLSIILLVGCASTEVKKDQPKASNLTDAQIEMLIVGKTMFDVDKRWTQKMSADGTMIETSGSGTENGSYTIKDGKYCSKWKYKRDGSTACWTIQKRAKYYSAKLVSGPSRSFKFNVR